VASSRKPTPANGQPDNQTITITIIGATVKKLQLTATGFERWLGAAFDLRLVGKNNVQPVQLKIP